MTLAELKTKCEDAGFQYAYGSFADVVTPPHLVAYEAESNNFFADNIVYKKKKLIKMDYTFITKDEDEQDKIEDEILGEIAWEKTPETYLKNEKVFQVSYFFEI